ncbi:putative sulfurylase large subunit (molybdopterin cytosine dinucleotide biosynthesis) [Humitalea rosea]|uniref:Putative sulfurylase large subunit (Molybdopterin cytosine dinucleotide biosynthesis) n=1 Tax=Humitalea rosea TaxID=990373 RepID=A0A2W7IWB6_9PROT|nr:XdhC family protein [Humitalea rosea]PZW51048.1 putative sulfurylase large subunit (molybdopterin cytosine dinucleotide biosynthesis) [Humitalea rosea]
MTPDMLARIAAARVEGRGVTLLTRLTDGAQRLWPDEELAPALAEAAEAALRDDLAANLTLDGEAWFIHPQAPALRLIIVGAVHVAQALAPMAAAAGFAVIIVDPRGAFASEERFPSGVTLNHDWPDDAMKALAPDARTAIVTLTHDPKLDDPALDTALASPAFYIGALGSRRTHAKRLERLGELGHGPEATRRIHAPIGLDIGAVTAPEIALSIIAEIVAVRRGPRRAAKAAA